jgi:hypothetical protein
VLAGQPPERIQALLDGGESLGVRLEPVQVPAEAPEGIVQGGGGRDHRGGGLAEVGVGPCGLFQHPRRARGDGGSPRVVAAQQGLGLERRGPEPLHRRQPPPLGLERGLLPGRGRESLQLVQLEPGELGPRVLRRPVAPQRLPLGLERDERRVHRPVRLQHGPHALPPVQHRPVHGGLEEAHVRVLSGDVQLAAHELPEDPHRRERAIDVHLAPARAPHHPAEHDLLAVIRQSQGLQALREPRCALEHGLHHRLVGAGAHAVRVGPGPEEEPERVHQDALPCPGLPRQDGQPGAEADLDLLHDREALDPKRLEHGRLNLRSGSSLSSCPDTVQKFSTQRGSRRGSPGRRRERSGATQRGRRFVNTCERRLGKVAVRWRKSPAQNRHSCECEPADGLRDCEVPGPPRSQRRPGWSVG